MVLKVRLDVVKVLVSMPRALSILRRVLRPVRYEMIVVYYKAAGWLDEVYVNMTEAFMDSDWIWLHPRNNHILFHTNDQGRLQASY